MTSSVNAGASVHAGAEDKTRLRRFDYGSDAFVTNERTRKIQIPWTRLSKDEVEAVCRRLVDREAEEPVRVLDLMDNQLGPSVAAKLTSCLESSPTSEVFLRYNGIGKEGCDGLAGFVTISSKARKIDVRGNDLSATELRKLLRAMAVSTSITHVGLASNKLGPDGASVLFKALEKNTYITYLDLSTNDIGPDGAAVIAKLLATPASTIRTLLLYGNQLGTKGFAHICHAMRTNKEVRVLTLGNNNARDSAAIDVAEMLKANTTLESLDLRLNTITANGMKTIAQEGLANNFTLSSLCLSGNPFGPGGADHLSRALIVHQRCALTSLDVSSCELGSSGGLRIASLIGSSITLKDVNLSDNEIDDEAANALAENLASSMSVSTVDLSMNAIAEAGATKLIDTAQVNPNLTCLILQGNSFGRVTQKRIDTILEERMTHNRIEVVNPN